MRLLTSLNSFGNRTSRHADTIDDLCCVDARTKQMPRLIPLRCDVRTMMLTFVYDDISRSQFSTNSRIFICDLRLSNSNLIVNGDAS